MSHFDSAEVARVAALARIDLADDEIERLVEELAVISDSVAKVREVATSDVPATSHPITLSNVTRPDKLVEPLDLDEVLSQAPAAADSRFEVPQILGEDA